jgi:pimeloyl-ACP methyl ester carboxylesterase
VAAAQNHGLLSDEDRPLPPLASIAAPTLVVHGTDDAMFPLDHGTALADQIPNAKLLALSGAGHGIDPDDWDTVIGAIVGHTRAESLRRLTPEAPASQH